MQIEERLGNGFRVPAGMLDVVADRLPINADVNDDIVPDHAVVHKLARPQLYVQAVSRGVVIEFPLMP